MKPPLGTCLLFLLGGSACERPGLPRPVTAPSAQTAHNLDSQLGPNVRYALSCEQASQGAACLCRFQLRNETAVLGAVDVTACTAPDVTPVAATLIPGAGDPLADGEGWSAWRVGSGPGQLHIAAKRLRIGPDAEGLIVRASSSGGPHDMLLLRAGTRLQRVAIPGTWSALDVRAEGDGPDRISLFARSPAEVSALWLNEARWDQATSALQLDAAHGSSAFLAVVGPFATSAEARAASACLPAGTLVTTAVYAGLPGGAFALAAITRDKLLAERALAGAECPEGVKRQVIALQFRDEPFAEYSLGAAGKIRLGFGRHEGAGWPIMARLAAQNAAGAAEVGWPVQTPLSAATEDTLMPAGDPLLPLRTGWSLGADTSEESLAVQRVRQGEGREALLLSAEAGFEHTKRRHTLLDVHDGRLRVLDSHMDSPGPTWSTTIVRPHDASSDEVLTISYVDGSAENQPDRVTLERATYSAGSGRVTRAPVPCDSVRVLVLRRFRSLEAATAAKNEACAAPDENPLAAAISWVVLPATKPDARGSFALAQLTTQTRLATELLRQVSRCWKGVRPELESFCARKHETTQGGE